MKKCNYWCDDCRIGGGWDYDDNQTHVSCVLCNKQLELKCNK